MRRRRKKCLKTISKINIHICKKNNKGTIYHLMFFFPHKNYLLIIVLKKKEKTKPYFFFSKAL